LNHTLFLKQDGTLWGMGDNSSGQLGLGNSVTSVNVPTQIATNVQVMIAGAQHSVFEDGLGNLWAMGANSVGQLGDGTYANSFVPEIVAPGVLIAALGSGPTANHTLVAGLPLPPGFSQSPANQTIAAGAPLAFSVVANGFPPFTYQWWKDGTKIIGATNATLTVTNAQITDSGLYNAVVIGSYGMAVGLPVRGVVSTLALIACGLNTSAQLGIYTNNPATELSPIGTPNAAVYAQAGADFSAFLDAAGTLWTVGANSYGELGQGLGSGYQMIPRPVATSVVWFSACENTLLFVKSDQTLWAAGNNTYGQFGVASPPNANTPVYVTNGVVLVAAGGFHSMIIKTNGQLYVAGNNAYGQLGLGSTPSAAGFVHLADGVCAASAGYDHSLFITTNGSLCAMGDNTHGELGDGTFTTRTTPELVTSNVIAATAGSVNSMFIRNDHTLWTFGYNVYGQLGNGSTSDTNRPTVIASNVVSVAAGQSHTVFVQTNGAAWGMGYDFVGQLGLGPNPYSPALPVRLLNGAPVAYAGTGPTAQHTLFIAAPTPPIITSQPINQILAVGNQALFSVGAFGFAPISYQWSFNSNSLSGAASSNLTLLSVTMTNAGVYQAIAANGFGSVTSSLARLAIAPVPSLTSLQLQADRTIKVACGSNQLTIGGRLVAATNLLTPMSQWLTLTNFPAGPAAPVTFTDTAATNHWTRYYRTVWP
jgi:alpha-tubulin suppressor-like RCC1 family protein